MGEFDGNSSEANKNEGSDGSSLRAFAEAQAKENAELKARLATAEATIAAQSFRSIWDGLDVTVPEKVRKFYTGDPDADAVKKWVEENQDAFRFEPKTPTDGDSAGDQSANADAAAQQAAVNAATSLGSAAGNGGYAAQLAQMKNARPTSQAELNAALAFLPD
ncbi:hypothetical protein [Umezawaea sp. NPDC059074]|uniref:hypothetical protein n=1 Tax=Umezawaea sp. NPDC059074 TaxID=3346716 RepID=UPI0036CC2B42